MGGRQFRDRRHAGQVLAGLLDHHRGRADLLVLALPRGGLPVAFEVATALGAALDVFVVRKLGVPHREELAMGAIASGGPGAAIVVMNDDVVHALGVEAALIGQVIERERIEVDRRERAYRQGRVALRPADRTVIVVDDGLATGASMRAAVVALRRLHPERIVMAVPVAPASTLRELEGEVDEAVCAATPSPFFAVGTAYRDFTQTTDEEVRTLLGAAGPGGEGLAPVGWTGQS